MEGSRNSDKQILEDKVEDYSEDQTLDYLDYSENVGLETKVFRRKRRYGDENRRFNPEWEERFAFIPKDGRPLCVICNKHLTQYKVWNLKRHYEIYHKDFSLQYPVDSEKRKNKINELKAIYVQDLETDGFEFDGEDEVEEKSKELTDEEFLKSVAVVMSLLDPCNLKYERLMGGIVSHFDKKRSEETCQKGNKNKEATGCVTPIATNLEKHLQRHHKPQYFELLEKKKLMEMKKNKETLEMNKMHKYVTTCEKARVKFGVFLCSRFTM